MTDAGPPTPTLPMMPPPVERLDYAPERPEWAGGLIKIIAVFAILQGLAEGTITGTQIWLVLANSTTSSGDWYLTEALGERVGRLLTWTFNLAVAAASLGVLIASIALLARRDARTLLLVCLVASVAAQGGSFALQMYGMFTLRSRNAFGPSATWVLVMSGGWMMTMMIPPLLLAALTRFSRRLTIA